MGPTWPQWTLKQPVLRGGCARQLEAFIDSFEVYDGAVTPPMLQEYTDIMELNLYHLEVKHGVTDVADAATNAVLTVNEPTKRGISVTVVLATMTRFTDVLQEYVETSLEAAVLASTEQEVNVDVPDCLVGSKYIPKPVPTGVARGRRGELLVSILQGGAGDIVPRSTARRIQLRRGPGRATTVAGGMHDATGVDRTPNGDLYMAQMFGNKVSVTEDGRRYD